MDKTDRLRDYGLAFLLYEQGLGVCGYELIRELFIFVKLILNSYLYIIKLYIYSKAHTQTREVTAVTGVTRVTTPPHSIPSRLPTREKKYAATRCCKIQHTGYPGYRGYPTLWFERRNAVYRTLNTRHATDRHATRNNYCFSPVNVITLQAGYEWEVLSVEC